MGKPSRQICKKKLDGECLICGETDYAVLHAHRIIEGGTYDSRNVLTCCSNCHMLIHQTDRIKFDRKYLSTRGWILHWWMDNKEMWTPVIS